MNNKYINIYNNLVNLTRNKKLYSNFTNQDTFSDRLMFFLFHFAFFLKFFKKDNKKTLQEIYDYIFRQLELSIREIGYGDQTINKKMKNYLNLFYGIIDEIDGWENNTELEKRNILAEFLYKDADLSYLVEYFNNYRSKLLNNSLNFYIKGVNNQ